MTPKPSQTGPLAKAEHAANAVFDWVASGCGWLLVLMALMITFDIILRELRTVEIISFNWQFVSEWSAFFVILIVFAGLAHTLQSGGHITVNIFINKFPLAVQRVLAIVTAVISESVLVYMFYRSIVWMNLSIERGITSTSVHRTPMWIPNFFVVSAWVCSQ